MAVEDYVDGWWRRRSAHMAISGERMEGGDAHPGFKKP
jgi:hypothetical protein